MCRHNFPAFRNCVNRKCHTAKQKIASAESRTISKRRATQFNDRMEWKNAVGKSNENENRIEDVSVHIATERMALITVINKNYVHESWGTKTEKRQRMENIKIVFLLFLYARHTVLYCNAFPQCIFN